MTPFNRRAQAILLASALASWPVAAFAQARERPSDKAVKTLIEQVDEGRDKFEGNLDGQFKGSTVHGPGGETKVSDALQAYQDSTQKLKQRFTDDYSASAEVTTVLKQSALIDAFMKTSPGEMKGRSEWDLQVTNVKRLAEAYGATFPLADGATVRRMNDKETAGLAEAVAAAAERVKGDLDNDKTLAKPEEDAAKETVEMLIKQSDEVKSRIGDGKPATGEVRLLVEQAAKLQAFLDGHQIASGATNSRALQAAVVKLQQAFGLVK